MRSMSRGTESTFGGVSFSLKVQQPVCIYLYLHLHLIYIYYWGKPRWLYTVIGWQIVHSWWLWLAGGFITLCKTFQTLMCNRALSLYCCSAPCSSHYKHAAPALEHLFDFLVNSHTTSLGLTGFKYFHMSLWHKQGLQSKHSVRHFFHS